ncbi:MAG: substrate-binding domain-containing protein [Bacteroidales bacterium]|nr:substrate-binding domain-containing protein [Bacteroidales bacterium]
MRKLFWILSVVLLAATACQREAPYNDPVGIAMIVKNGQIDYFRQIETSFRDICQQQGLEAYYYSTSSETDYKGQVAAVEELGKLGKSALKGIIFSPGYGPNGENAEAEVAALAKERGIPVIILDSHVSANGPLASCPYIGTDNTAAGKAMAEYVSADKVAVFAMQGSPGIERAEAFKAVKPGAVIYRVGDKCNDEVQAVLNDYDDFVFFNGNDLVSALSMLQAAGKRVYTFDVYGEFLDLLMKGSPCLRGVMAQNTFAMARKAVQAVLAKDQQGEMVPTFYINGFTLDADEVQPFLEFYNKQVPDLNVAEKIIGKWMFYDRNGELTPTNKKRVFTFVSTTKAYVSAAHSMESAEWFDHTEAAVAIDGNKVTLTMQTDEHTTMVDEFVINSINESKFSGLLNVTVTKDGDVVRSSESNIRLTKQTADYSEAILGLWECKEMTGDQTYNDANARLEFLADGTYRYYRLNDNGRWETVTNREFQNYFVDGSVLCTRWKNPDEDELREWWEIYTLGEGWMVWTALRQKEDGTTFQQNMVWEKIDLNVTEKIIGKWMQTEIDGQPALTNKKTVATFYSSTLATVSTSREMRNSSTVWSINQEFEVKIEGNKVTLTSQQDESTTLVNEYIVTDINDSEMICTFRHLTIRNGEQSNRPMQEVRFVKQTADYTAAILGTWEGRCTSEGSEFDDGQVHRWAYKGDGTFVYYVKDGDKWVPSQNTLNEYFVDGNLLCTRWIDLGQENREWWEITIDGSQMHWTALRQNPDGTTFTATFEMTKVPGIAMIAKGGQIDYWRQIETAFLSICQDKGISAYYCSTSADNAYSEQVEAVKVLSEIDPGTLKGIIFAPCYGPDGESAEAEVAALAKERGIPVIILDSPATATGPLAGCPFIGTDNTAAGKELAQKVSADKVAAFAKINTPGVERAQAFLTEKPATELFTVSESAASEVAEALSNYDDFVFFNGSNLVDVLATLKNAGKRVYTFDIYGDFLDELLAGGTCLQGIMAQNTFAMARRAVDAVLDKATEGKLVPTFYITASNVTSPDVMPYLLYYNKLDGTLPK